MQEFYMEVTKIVNRKVGEDTVITLETYDTPKYKFDNKLKFFQHSPGNDIKIGDKFKVTVERTPYRHNRRKKI